jgi:hypothetical protein
MAQRYTQPQGGPAQVDKNTSIGRDLALLINAIGGALDDTNIVTGFRCLGSGASITRTTNAAGKAYKLAGVNSVLTTDFSWVQVGTGDFTLATVARSSAGATFSMLAGVNNPGGGSSFSGLISNGTWQYSDGNALHDSSITPSAQKPDVVVVVRRSGIITIAVNGVIIPTATTDPAAYSNTLELFCRRGLGSEAPFIGEMNLFAAAYRAWSNAEIRSFCNNPWQVFKSAQRAIPAAAPTGVSTALAWLEASDIASISASATVTGSASWTEASDTAVITASIIVSGATSWTEQSDTSAITVSAKVNATASWGESNDTASLAANMQANAACAWTEASDATAITATVGNAVSASVAWVEASDIAALTTAVTVSGSAAWTEAGDIVAIAASVGSGVSANVAWAEASDSTALLTTIRVSASAGWAEQADLTGFSAQILARAALGWNEQSDTIAIVATSGLIIAPYVSPARTVNFGGGTNQANFGGGTNRVDFDGGPNRVNF